MPQISTQEFEQLPVRVRDFLVGVPLHDVWAVDLPRTRPGITLDEFLRAATTRRPHRGSLGQGQNARSNPAGACRAQEAHPQSFPSGKAL
jgi:hypothetical protein